MSEKRLGITVLSNLKSKANYSKSALTILTV